MAARLMARSVCWPASSVIAMTAYRPFVLSCIGRPNPFSGVSLFSRNLGPVLDKNRPLAESRAHVGRGASIYEDQAGRSSIWPPALGYPMPEIVLPGSAGRLEARYSPRKD